MGLDMYLYRRNGKMSWGEDGVYIPDEELYEGNALKPQYEAMRDARDAWFHNGSVGPEPKAYYYQTDVEEVGYWRKANQIHGWFVTHCQDGLDECQFTPVHHEQLKGLYDACVEIIGHWEAGSEGLKEIVMEVLPPTGGFFFGGYDIDEYYFRDIRQTIDILEPLLSNPPTPSNPYCLAYTSSW